MGNSQIEAPSCTDLMLEKYSFETDIIILKYAILFYLCLFILNNSLNKKNCLNVFNFRSLFYFTIEQEKSTCTECFKL